MTTDEVHSDYWHAVALTLVAFFSKSPVEAYQLTRSFQKSLASTAVSPGCFEGPPRLRPPDVRTDILEHESPYRLAADLAGTKGDIDRDWDAYNRLIVLVVDSQRSLASAG